MAKYFLTNKAVEDLSDIWEYTCGVWSESQADKYYGLLIEAFEEIALNPAHGKRYEKIDPSILGLRVSRHIVFYRAINADEIEVLRILHERMDLRSRMEE